ncbi:hypothetical protein GGU10DRAFT_399762 [Lentinula aff. detonsa]|uniref:BAH domain-containing protein n=1 Tax=Lentinula aff. detonsa TaxID=2804958 RepID=A0AA38L591_9AGAR|nr:hypothetical protein GGU10DRAFT_399762 [Lentinula aff. detonsa]
MARTKTKRKKSGGNIVDTGGDPEAPTNIEWESMALYKKFIVTKNALNEGEENVEYLFEVGDYVSILPPDLPDGYGVEDGPAPPIQVMWLGLIKDIRMRYKDGEQEAWARIQWFYSKKDIKNSIQNFDITHLGENERLLSDHFDLVHSYTFDDVVPIQRFHFAPTYQDAHTDHSASSSSVDARHTALYQMFNQKEICASNSQRKIGSIYPNIYYRYDFEINSKRIVPEISELNCFSPASASHHPSRARSKYKSNRRPLSNATASNSRPHAQNDQYLCHFESSYSPPDSERARKIGRRVAVLVREAHSILEDGISRILGFSFESKSSPTRAGATTRASRIRGELSQSVSDTPESGSLDSSMLFNTAKQLAYKMQQAILLEDTVAMHVCPRAQCTACGRAWHRSCLIRDQVTTEEGVERVSTDNAEDSVQSHEALQHLQSWIARHHGQARSISSPSFDHVMSQWKAMSPSQKQEVERMLQLLCTVPPGYDRSPNMSSEGIYEFPVLYSDAGNTSTTESKRGKRKARPSEQEELEVSADLLLDEGSTSREKRTRDDGNLISRLKANKVVVVDADKLKSPKKQRRSVRLPETDMSMIEHVNTKGTPQPSRDDENEEHIPRIMYSLSLLLAPELICLASQPLVRGGVYPISLSSRTPNYFTLAGTSPIFSPLSPFGRAVQTTITGNISQVTHARIMVYNALDRMSLQQQELGSGPETNMIIQEEWADYIVELEGREWLFELSDSANTTTKKDKPASSRDETRKMVLTRTHSLLRLWQAHRRTVLLCPSCKSDI